MTVRVLNSASEVVKIAADDLNSRAFKQHAALFVIQCKKTKRVLVVKRFKDHQIGLPCGKMEPFENPADAAYRELFEETGLPPSAVTRSRYLASIQFEGTLVHVFQGETQTEQVVAAAKGFEDETAPRWVSIEDLVKTESRFQSFNIIALHKAGLF